MSFESSTSREPTIVDVSRDTSKAAMLAQMARGGEVIRIGRYELAGQLATGGMAAVHLGRIRGAQGFSRVVVIKRILPEFASKPDFVRMFVNEARLAARVRHPSVVATLDAVEHSGELLLIMEFVHGLSLAKLVALATGCNGRIPVRIGAAVVASSLRGIHAAHEAKDELGRPLTIVHRDVSPQNILVGRDGLARVLDFGVAKAVDQTRSTTMFGEFKGKMTYAAPEQVLFQKVSRTTDIYAAGLVLWELATGQRRYGSSSHGAIIKSLTDETVPMPTTIDRTLPRALDRIIHYATQRDPAFRYRTAADMAREIEEQIGVATGPDVAAWLAQVAAPELTRLDDIVASVETNGELAADDLSLLSPTEIGNASTDFATQTVQDPPRFVRRSPLPILGALAGATVVLAAAGIFAAQRDSAVTQRDVREGTTMVSGAASYSSVSAKDSAASLESSSVVPTRHLPSPSPPPPPPPSTRPSATPTPPPPPPVDCAPPYYFDPSGIKHVKPGCG